MGLFGSIFKAVGKIAKAGASALTHGASDQVLKVLKGRGQVKQVLAKGPNSPATNNEVATVAKRLPVQRITGLGAGQVLNSLARRVTATGLDAYNGSSEPSTKRVGKGSRTKRAKAAPRARARSSRAAPAGGLDLKRISQMWNAEGKPGTWLNYIKAHSDVRKA